MCLTLPTLRQEVFPSIQLELVSVTVLYPGASPEEVEKSITNRIEDALQGLPGIKRIRSTSSESVTSVSAELLTGEDVRDRLDDIRAAVDAIDTFPDDAEEPMVQQAEIRNLVLRSAIWCST